MSSRLNTSIGSIMGRLGKKGLPAVQVTDYRVTHDSRHAKVLLSAGKPLTEDVASDAITLSSEGQLGYLPNSLVAMKSSGPTRLYRAVVTPVVKERPIEDTAGMSKITDMQYLDGSGYVWTVDKSANGNRILMSEEEDLSGILAARCKTLGYRTPSLDVASNSGDFASVLCGNEIKSGFLIATGDGNALLMNPKYDEPIKVSDSASILSSFNPRELHVSLDLQPYTDTASGAVDHTALWDWMHRAWDEVPGSEDLIERLMGAAGER